ncbi:MAG: hypothetical protein AAB855_02180, partial [Patescibacteria group bacterium]
MLNIGIDEVGRGAWAGPVVIAAVLLDESTQIPRDVLIRDSKALNRASRERSAHFLRKSSTFCTLLVPGGTVDKFGVHMAIAKGFGVISRKIKAKIIREQ